MKEADTIKMTDEEMIDTLKGLVFGTFDRTTSKEREALDMVIKKIEQQPCEDVTAFKEDVLDAISRIGLRKSDTKEVKAVAECLRAVEALSPVTQHESKTVLYSGDGYADGYMVYDMAECPNCGYEYEDGDKDWGLPFCPNCGQSLDWESEEQA